MRRIPLYAFVGLLGSLGSASTGCIEPITLEPEIEPGEVGIGETRTIELRHIRLDVEGFGKKVSLEQLRALRQFLTDVLR